MHRFLCDVIARYAFRKCARIPPAPRVVESKISFADYIKSSIKLSKTLMADTRFSAVYIGQTFQWLIRTWTVHSCYNAQRYRFFGSLSQDSAAWGWAKFASYEIPIITILRPTSHTHIGLHLIYFISQIKYQLKSKQWRKSDL